MTLATNSARPAANTDVKYLVLIFLALVVAFHLGLAAKGHGLFRDIHLGTALHYAQTKIDLKDTQIAGFNATGTPTIQELPVWQMVAGGLFKVFGTRWWGWANLVSLVLFLHCLFPLFKLARMYLDERTAYWTLIFFLAQPLAFTFAGEAATDGFCISVAIWFLYCAVKLVREPGWQWLTLAVIFGGLTAVSKLPFFMAMGLTAFLLLLVENGFNFKKVGLLGSVGLISGLVFLAWTHYTDAAQAGALFPYVDLRVKKGTPMMFWYFGDLKYRLQAGNWIRGGWRILNALFGSFVLVGLAVVAWRNRSGHPVARLLAWMVLFTTLVFCHLVLQHWHYYLMLAPAVAMLCAEGWVLIEVKFAAARRGVLSLSALAAGLLLLSLGQGLMAMKILTIDKYPGRMADVIRQHTTETDKLVIVGGGWGGEEFLRSGRSGLSAWDAHIFDAPADLVKLKSLGYDKLVMISESPLQNAIEVVTPGQAGKPRIWWRDLITPQVENWPTLFQSDEILIKGIP
jgi:hypothetical protein